ncbi:hypothetical protein J3F83DRAFT_454627 [Trichoderma novae-zelandiae]
MSDADVCCARTPCSSVDARGAHTVPAHSWCRDKQPSSRTSLVRHRGRLKGCTPTNAICWAGSKSGPGRRCRSSLSREAAEACREGSARKGGSFSVPWRRRHSLQPHMCDKDTARQVTAAVDQSRPSFCKSPEAWVGQSRRGVRFHGSKTKAW